MGDRAVAAAKEEFTSLDARALARDLRALPFPRFDKAFDWGTRGWTLSLRVRPEGRVDLVLAPGAFGAVVAEPVPHEESPGPFARELRRLLGGAVLGRVADPAGERSLVVEFVRADGTPPTRLIAEFFGNGNLTLVAEGRIVAVARPRKWAHRTLRTGETYRPAPGRPDPWSAPSAWIESLLLASRADRARTLATRAGFGGPVAEELLARADLEPGLAAPTEAGSSAAAVHRAAQELREEVDRGGPAFLYRVEGAWVDVTPFPSRRRRSEPGVTEESRPGFGAAVLEYFRARPAAPAAAPRTDSRRQSLSRQRARQADAVSRLEEEAARLSAQADRIFQSYLEVEEARAALDPDGPVLVEIPVGDLRVPIDRTVPAEVSARRLYEGAKRIRAKLSGARSAYADTEQALERAEPEPAAPAPAIAPEEPARRPLWFQRYRWFFSSEGILVLGGRDSASNDQLVKKHLGAGDRYVHADLHGAASVVVKRSFAPGPEPGAATLREAGEFAVSFSKAWRAGHASADAFWVEPEQVSKTAASGEFVARGAWVIHGTKHPLKDLPLRLGIGTQEYEHRTLWTAAPESALRARGSVRYVVTPGEERRRAEREIELVGELGVSRPVLQSLLPAGGIDIRRA